METALRGYQRFDLGKTANFEPAPPANIPGYIANNSARLLFMPVPGGPNEDVISWLTPSDPGSATLQSHFNRKTLRDWKNAHPKHRSFCVVSHPLERSHRVFWNFVLDKENDEFVNVRQKLMNRYMVPLVNRDNDLKSFQYKEAFLRILKFLQSNLVGQTTVQVHPLWASQVLDLQILLSLISSSDHMNRQRCYHNSNNTHWAFTRPFQSPVIRGMQDC